MARPALASVSLPDHGLWQKARAKRIPLSFELELTARCTNDCRHCYINLPAGDAAAQARELSAAEIDGLARQAVELGSLWCLVTGGEPLLRPDFADIYLALKKRGLLVSVFTNACLVDDRIIELFKKYPPRDIEVTVYGVTRETYEAVSRAPGSYDRFLVGLSQLAQAGIKPRLKAMAMRSNVHELPQIAAFCRRYTKDSFRFDPQLHLRYDRDPQRNALILQERLAAGEAAALERSDSERYRALQRECDTLLVKGKASQARSLFFCRAGLSSFTIGWDGTFKLCGSLTAPDCGYDLRSGSLRQAWLEFAPRIRSRQPAHSDYAQRCGRCDLINLCLWCPAHAYLETGVIDRPVERFCQGARARRSLLP